MTIEDDIAFLERVPISVASAAAHCASSPSAPRAIQCKPASYCLRRASLADCAYVVQQGSFDLYPGRVREGAVVIGPGTLLGETRVARRRRSGRRRRRPAKDSTVRAPFAHDVSEDARKLSRRRATVRDLISREPINGRSEWKKSLRSWHAERANVRIRPRSSPSPARGRTAARRRGNSWRWRCRDTVGKLRRGPDVIEAAAAVGGLPDPPRGSSTTYRALAGSGVSSRMLSTQSPALRAAVSFSTSIGVCETTRSICL